VLDYFRADKGHFAAALQKIDQRRRLLFLTRPGVVDGLLSIAGSGSGNVRLLSRPTLLKNHIAAPG
jgi:hypothetical protein